MVYVMSENCPSRERTGFSLAFILSASWNVEAMLELNSVLDDEVEATLKAWWNRIEAWVSDDCLSHHYLGFSFSPSQIQSYLKGPGSPHQVSLDPSLKSGMSLGL